jgi:DNA-directed RNA polymerase
MATKAQIAEQVQLERDQIRQGIKKLQDNTKKLEGKSYASATVYGVASIDALLPLVVAEIEKTINARVLTGKNGVAYKEIKEHITQLEPLAAAAIACKLTFDQVFSVKDKSDQAVNVCTSIGAAVEAECQMRHYEREAPGLLNTLKKNYWHSSIGTHQKLVVIKTLMNRYDVKSWQPWGQSLRLKLGGWLLDCIIRASGWFDKQARREGKKTTNYIVPTPEFLEIKDRVMHDAELFAPLAYPMLIEPNDWTNDRPGGYLLNEVMRGHDMVRRGDPTLIQGETPINFLNKIQKVGYRLNPFTVGVAEVLEQRQIAVGKFIPIVEIPLPTKPFDIAENYDSRKDYRRRAAEVMNKNAQAFKRSCRTRMTMEAVKRFKNREQFFLPWSFDYRGRAYPIPAFLTPQDTDFGKSLIRFADESFMTPEAEQWLAFQVATTYGLDKAPMYERLEWVANNLTIIERIATDPIGCLSDWEAVEEPWQFLAACEEYYACVIACTRSHTGLMVATDATCSGLQILAGLARDKSTARLVNVLPGDRPQDAYKVVAEAATPNCPERLQEFMDRKVTKRVVMTVPYNAKPRSNRGYIREALKEKGIELETDELNAVVKAVRDAMDRIVPGPMAVMKWIELEVAAAIKRGADYLKWVTPSGFVVFQKLMKKQIEQQELQLLGRCKVNVCVGDTDEVDLNHHKNATSPNLIHSLDASLLHLATMRFGAPIALIHDSVLCRATDMSVLSTLVRETYMHLFAEHDYLKDFAKQIGAESDPPIIGDLEPETVIDSTYFFC